MPRGFYQVKPLSWNNSKLNRREANRLFYQFKNGRNGRSLWLRSNGIVSLPIGAIAYRFGLFDCGSATELFTFYVDAMNLTYRGGRRAVLTKNVFRRFLIAIIYFITWRHELVSEYQQSRTWRLKCHLFKLLAEDIPSLGPIENLYAKLYEATHKKLKEDL